MYIFSQEFLDHLVLRLTGPMNFRFIIQPVVSVLLGIRDGRKDARAGVTPFVVDVLFASKDRAQRLAEAAKTVSKPILIGVILDAVAQFLMLGTVHPLAAFLVGSFLIAVPYALARGLSNRALSLGSKSRPSVSCQTPDN